MDIFEHPVELDVGHVVHFLGAMSHSFGAKTQQPVKPSDFSFFLPDILQSVLFVTSTPLWFLFVSVQLGNINLGDARIVLDGLASWVGSLLVQQLLLH